MKGEILGLRTAIYKVEDIKEARRWYSKAFETEPYFDEPFYVGFDICGYELGLQPVEQPIRAKAESVVAYWGVLNISEKFNRFITLGATECEKPKDVGQGIIVAKLIDPWGNIIGLIHNPNFKVIPL